MSDRVINLGLVGCGYIAGPCADDFRNYDYLRLKGVTDINNGCSKWANVQ